MFSTENKTMKTPETIFIVKCTATTMTVIVFISMAHGGAIAGELIFTVIVPMRQKLQILSVSIVASTMICNVVL